MHRIAFIGLVCLGLGGLMAGPLQAAESSSAPARALHDLFQRAWDDTLERSPTRASALGDRRWNDLWEDLSPEAIQAAHEQNQRFLRELKSIDRNALAPADQLNYDLFQKTYANRVEGFQFRWHLIALNQRGGIQTRDELADALRFETVQDFEDWLARLRAFPVYMDQTIALLREGIREKMVLPRVVMERVPKQIANQIVDEPDQSPFFRPFHKLPLEWEFPVRARLQAQAALAVTNHVVPAFKRLARFIEEEYLPACFPGVGAWQMPRGDAMYDYFARTYTTTALTPEQIHEIGLREVKRIRAAMEVIPHKVGFQGSMSDFFEHLRTAPEFYHASGEELLAGYRALSKKIDPLMVRLFRVLPRMPYGVEPIPEAIAPDTTTAYYRPPAADGSRAGSYFVNLHRPETRPRYEMTALSLHEAVPGHHFQIALAMELGALPEFRRYGGYTAFIEGWGLYAEYLGEELGLYEDPYDKLGQLTYEMWRAIRLVVDTGIHRLRWSREKAIAFFKDNAAKAENDIINEVDRYIAWPGQALAYKIGELKIKELRREAESALGQRFDVRDFHDAVLGAGAVPLDVLETRVRAWLGEASAPPPPSR